MIDSDSECIILDPDKYEGEINHIEIPHGRARHRNGALTEEEQTILRAELGKLMWIARIARPGGIYDASAAAQTCLMAKCSIRRLGTKSRPKWRKGIFPERKHDFEHMPGFRNFTNKTIKCQ